METDHGVYYVIFIVFLLALTIFKNTVLTIVYKLIKALFKCLCGQDKPGILATDDDEEHSKDIFKDL